MSRISTLLLVFLLGFVGCQTAPTRPLGNIFSPETTIPPPGTNSYTTGSAPPQETQVASTNPPSGGEVSPYSPNRPYADPVPSEETDTTVLPFTSQPPAESVSAGSVKVAARPGDEVMIPVNAFRTDTGLYSGDQGSSQSQAAGTATELIHVGPFQ